MFGNVKVGLSALFIVLAIVAFFILFFLKSYSSNAAIPLQVIFENPEKILPQIIPNTNEENSYILYAKSVRMGEKDVMNLFVQNYKTKQEEQITFDAQRGIYEFFWSFDGTSVFYLQDQNGNENWNLYCVNVQNKETICLTPFPETQVSVVQYDESMPNSMIIAMNKENKELFDLYKVNLRNYEVELFEKNPGSAISWNVSAQQNAIAYITSTPEGGSEWYLKSSLSKEYKKINSIAFEDSDTSNLFHFSKDALTLYYCHTKKTNTTALYAYDVQLGTETLLYCDEKYDIKDIFITIKTNEIMAVSIEKDRKEWHILDAYKNDLEEHFFTIAGLHRGTFSIENRDLSNRYWIVRFTSDTKPSVWYLYDSLEKKGALLFYSRPKLLQYELQKMHSIRFEAQDGVNIEGYITYPKHFDKNKNTIPLILNVHGGPWARDSWGYHPEAQWFASLGYACLQVNFRGSTGYGKEFVNLGNKEWSRKMHTDLLNAVEYVISQGGIDRNKVVIYGGSYGGYAALVGLTFTPTFFAGGIDIVGPSSLITLMQSIPPYWKPILSNFYKRVGNLETEKEFLESCSPISKVDNIQRPLMVVHGANDPRVKLAEAKQIVNLMEEKGIMHEFLLFENEGHGLLRPENRFVCYEAIEKFLKKIFA